MPKKPLKHYRQSTGLCGPASLKILLSHYGKEYTESELADFCNATADDGTDHIGLVRAAEKLGFKPIAKAGSSFEELRIFTEKDIPVIVGWWSNDGDHYSVVYDIEGEIIRMMDPELDEGIRELSRADFEKIWYDFDGKENIRVERWLMALPPREAVRRSE